MQCKLSLMINAIQKLFFSTYHPKNKKAVVKTNQLNLKIKNLPIPGYQPKRL